MALMEKERGLREGKGLSGEPEMPLGGARDLVTGEVKLLFNWLAIGEAVAMDVHCNLLR